jgi:hypothetical protein
VPVGETTAVDVKVAVIGVAVVVESALTLAEPVSLLLNASISVVKYVKINELINLMSASRRRRRIGL